MQHLNTIAEYKYFVKSDLYRYIGKTGWKTFWNSLLLIPGFRYTYMLRTAAYLKSKRFFLLGYIIARLLLRRYQFKFGISIPYNTNINAGLYIGHFGGIFVNYESQIGFNCNINHGVTIGKSYGGKVPGTPTIGNNVYFGPGSKVIGGIIIGNNVAIGTNCVVTKNIPDNAVVVGIPGEIISYNGSSSYIVNTVA